MADSTVSILEPNVPTSILDVSQLTNNSAQTVKRERLVLADDAVYGALAKIINITPVGTEYGLTVRIAGAVTLVTNPSSSTTRQLGIVYGSQGVAFAQAAGGTNELLAQLSTSGTVYDARLIRALTNADIVSAQDQVYDGTAYLSRRAPSVFKTVGVASSGDTVVWTPTAGKKFRLLKYLMEITGDVAQSSGGDVDISLRDVTTPVFTHSVFVPGSAGATFAGYVTGLDLGDKGYLSNAANNVLNINLSSTLTSGKVRINAMGTEE